MTPKQQMPIIIPQQAIQYGFVIDGLGPHSSRTMMLAELRLLLENRPPETTQETYRVAVLDENALLKKTETTRRKSFRYLRELYSLDPETLLFRALRDLWTHQVEAQPMLALLCALARDPSLRATADVIQDASQGAPVTSQMLAAEAARRFASQLSDATLAKVGRNAASTWTQSGHLRGRTNKIRVQAESHPTSVAYVLLLGHLCGARGEALFQTPWARLLDASPHVLHELAFQASQQGWLEYRRTGGVTDVGFAYLLREEEEKR